MDQIHVGNARRAHGRTGLDLLHASYAQRARIQRQLGLWKTRHVPTAPNLPFHSQGRGKYRTAYASQATRVKMEAIAQHVLLAFTSRQQAAQDAPLVKLARMQSNQVPLHAFHVHCCRPQPIRRRICPRTACVLRVTLATHGKIWVACHAGRERTNRFWAPLRAWNVVLGSIRT